MESTVGAARTVAGSSAGIAGYRSVLGAAAVLYLVSVAPGLLWQDSAMAQYRVLSTDLRGDIGLALAHPLYYLVCAAFQWLPVGDAAFRTNLVSAVFGAVTVANLFALVRLLTGCGRAAAVAAAGLCVAHTFWQHCALAEVYTISTALLTFEFICFVEWRRSGQSRWLVLLFAAAGLGLSNHLIAILHLPVWLALVGVECAARRVTLGAAAACAAAWLAGASIYIALIAAELAGGRPASEVVRSALFGEIFAGNVLNTTFTPRLLLNTVLYFGLNFPSPTILLAAIGLWALARQTRAAAGPQPPETAHRRATAIALLAAAAIHLAWAIRYDVPDQYTFFIPTIVFLAVFAGCGAAAVLGRRPRWTAALLAGALLPAGVYVFLPDIARSAKLNIGVRRELPYRDTYRYFLTPWKTGDRSAERFARETLATLPPASILIAEDTTVWPIYYELRLTGAADAVELYPPVRGRFTVPEPTPQSLAGRFAAGRVFVVSPVKGYCPAWMLDACEFEAVGPVYRAMLKDSASPSGGAR